jgi:hypothetical protein
MKEAQSTKDQRKVSRAELAQLVVGRTDAEIAAGVRALLKRTSHKAPNAAKWIDVEKCIRMAEWGSSFEEIAAMEGVSQRTLMRKMEKDPKLRDLMHMGRERGKAKLRGVGFNKALQGDTTMLIWKGKQMLGERDNLALTGANGGPLELRMKPDLSRLSDAEIDVLLRMAERIMPPARQHIAEVAGADRHPAKGAPALSSGAQGGAPDSVIDVEAEPVAEHDKARARRN